MGKIIGLTGGIATGKSSVSKMLQKKGFEVVDADQIVYDLQQKGQSLLKEMTKTFGLTILNEDGSLNRGALGNVIFGDPSARAKLEELIHPEVKKECIRRMSEFSGDVLFLDVPLLFEAGFDDLTDGNVVVCAAKETQMKRLMLRDKRNIADAQMRIDAQMPLADKIAQADYVINNDGDMDLLAANVEKFLKNLKGKGD